MLKIRYYLRDQFQKIGKFNRARQSLHFFFIPWILILHFCFQKICKCLLITSMNNRQEDNKKKIKKNISCRPPKCANCFVFCRPPNWFLSWSKINKFLFWVSLHFYLLKKWVTTVKQFCTTCQNVVSQKSFHPNVDWSDIWQTQYPVNPQDSRMYYKINVRVNALGNKIVKI